MKRYHAFAYDTYSNSGGMGDSIGDFPSKKAAVLALEKIRADNRYAWDSKTGETTDVERYTGPKIRPPKKGTPERAIYDLYVKAIAGDVKARTQLVSSHLKEHEKPFGDEPIKLQLEHGVTYEKT
jgi:hypothetical protein